jgi:hypothetical protein
MEKMIVRLCRSDDWHDTFDLRYDLCKNAFVPKWIKEFQKTQMRNDPISTRDQFYGINTEWTAERVIKSINECIQSINGVVPGLIKETLIDSKDQDTLNRLHSYFERYHGKIDQWLTDPWWSDKPTRLRSVFSDLNNLIHRLEGYRDGEPRPKIRICWYDAPKTKKFLLEDYALFTHQYQFGVAYSLYSDVGKDLMSLTYDEDEHHLDFVNPTFYSTDLQLRFHNVSNDQNKKIKSDCEAFYDRNQNYFMSHGFTKNDPRLVTGSIPVAQLERFYYYIYDEKELLDVLSRYNRTQSVSIF